jgi:hypothetical protein
MVTMMVYILSGEFLGLYGNNDGIYSFQENSLVCMETMMAYVLQENSLVYMVTMIAYIFSI